MENKLEVNLSLKLYGREYWSVALKSFFKPDVYPIVLCLGSKFKSICTLVSLHCTIARVEKTSQNNFVHGILKVCHNLDHVKKQLWSKI